MNVNGKEYKARKAVLDLHAKVKAKFREIDYAWAEYNIAESEAGVADCKRLWAELLELVFEGEKPNVDELEYQDIAEIASDFFYGLTARREKLSKISQVSK